MQSVPVIVEYDVSQLQLFRKIDIPRHFIHSLDIATPGTKISLSTLEGIVEITADPDIYVMIGPCNDVYPIMRQRFEAQYQYTDGIDCRILDITQTYGWNSSKLRQCRLKDNSYIYATPVPYAFRVFLKEHNTYLHGMPGDYYAVPANKGSEHNPYIIRAEIMKQTYEPVKQA